MVEGCLRDADQGRGDNVFHLRTEQKSHCQDGGSCHAHAARRSALGDSSIAEHELDAAQERAFGAFERDGQLEPRSLYFLEAQQGLGVDDGIGTDRNCDLIAADFASLANGAAEPPDRGMEEQDALNGRLEEIAEVVEAADVGELVREDGLQF